jgi:hypothetical protein
MREDQEPIQPSATDFKEASLEWSKIHHKTSEQMQHLTDAETAECYLLARAYAMLRRWKAPKAEGQARGPRQD